MKRINKKAFTLIELLAVLVILSILLGIAVPAYYSYVQKSQKGAYQAAEESLTTAAMDAMLDCVNNRGKSFCTNKRLPQSDNEYLKMTLGDLIKGSYMDPIHDPKNRSNYCNEQSSYAYVLKNPESAKGGYTYYACLVCGSYVSEECDRKELGDMTELE